jgi:competence protein ComEC
MSLPYIHFTWRIENMNGRLVYIGIASLFGVLCTLQSFLLFFFLALVYIFILVKFKRFTSFELLFLISIFLLSLLSSQLALTHNKTKSPISLTLFYVEYIEDPTIDGDLLQIKVQDSKTHEKFLLRYKIESEKEKKLLETSNFYGQMCRVTGSLKEPKQAKNENAFNYRKYLNRNSVFWLLDSKKMPLQNCEIKKLNVITLIKQVRYQGIHYLKEHFPSEVAALSSALIYGDRSLMTPELLTNYQKAGISHLLAISGLHVALLVGMLFYFGIRLGVTREHMTNFILLFLPVYAVLTGGSPSVVRAVVTIFLVMATIKWENRLKLLPIDALSIAFTLFLLLNPMVLFDVGFQLSFSVTSAIIISGPSILQQYHNNLTRMLVTTVIAQLSALPFMLYHFFGVSLLSIFVNLIFIPLYSYLFLPGVYFLFFLQIIFGSVPMPLMTTFAKIVHFSNNITQLFSNFSFSDFTPGRPEIPFLVIDTVILLTIFILWEEKSRKRKGPIAVLCFSLLFMPAGWNLLNPFGEVSMIDVGQGDSILIHLPFGQGNYLIDTGGTLQFPAEPWQKRAKTFETGEDVVVPFLRGKGITRIDKLILTHGDTDHIGGTFAILKELKVKQILMPEVVDRSETERSIIQAAAERGVQVVFVSAGNKWERGASRFVILSPEKNFKGERNRGSIVVLAGIGGLTWFFGGDLDQEGEEEIVKKYPNVLIDVLKVGHHGSKTSSSEMFLNSFKPKIALISAGEKNRFGHPHQEVLDKLTKTSSTIFRTDKQGESTYRFFNGKGTFFTFLP